MNVASSSVEQMDTRVVAEVGGRLIAAVGHVTLDEFLSQEAHFDEDSRHGRELLYLAANDEWVRGTQEILDLAAANTLETTVRVHVDLGKITHEAIRDREGPVWLPLLVLPPPVAGEGHGTTPLAPSPRVQDSTGAVLPSLPQSEARRWMAAALAEIMLQMTPLTMRRARREHRLLLSAAVYRVLCDGLAEPRRGSAQPSTEQDGVRVSRMQHAREDLVQQLQQFVSTVRTGTPTPDGARAALLITRAALVVNAVSSPTTLVVVAVTAGPHSTEFAIQLPSRSLQGNRSSWLRSPRAQMQLGLLMPSGEADRSLTLQLPGGVSFRRLKGPTGVRAEVKVDRPPSWRRLGELVEQILDRARAVGPPDPASDGDPVLHCLCDLALAQIDVVRETYRYHCNDPVVARSADGVDVNPPWLQDLQAHLRVLNRGDQRGDPETGCPLAGSEQAWAVGRLEGDELFRILQADVVNPATAHVRVPAVEDRAARTSPSTASSFVHIEVASDTAASLYTARYAGVMSLTVLGVVQLLLFQLGATFDPQVLGGVLTLFAVIQASRIEQPDRSSLRGLLDSASSRLATVSVLPTVLLGVALAFSEEHLGEVQSWVWFAIGAQAAMVVFLFAGPHAQPGWPGLWPRLRLTSGLDLDHRRVDVLHTSWWRTTTAGALLLGRPAYGYVVLQDDHDLGALLGYTGEGPAPLRRTFPRRALATLPKMINLIASDPGPESRNPSTWVERAGVAVSQEFRTIVETPANLLAMLRAGTEHRSLTFLVFREQPSTDWREANKARPVILDTERLVAYEADIGHVDFYLGLPKETLLPIGEHPVSCILAEARAGLRTVLDVQLPAAPPVGGRAGRFWTRVRVGLRSRELSDLGTLLHRVHAAVEEAGTPDWELLVDMGSQSLPRRFLGTGPERPGGLPAPAPRTLLSPRELDVVSRVDAGPESGQWLILGICAYARSGVEADVLAELDAQRPGLQIAGLSTALMHGTTVIFILAFAPMDAPDPSAGPALVFKDAQLLVNELTTAERLGRPLTGHPGSLIQMHVVCSDRPGSFAQVLDRLGKELAVAIGVDFSRVDPSVLYTFTNVADGRLAVSRVMVRLALPPEDEDKLRAARLDDVERSLRRSMLAPAHAGGGRPEDSGWWDARAVVSLHLVPGPGLEPEPVIRLNLDGQSSMVEP